MIKPEREKGRNKMELNIARFKMSNEDCQKILDAVFYGTRKVAEELYRFNRPVYDENAGVFTDYGENDPNRTWAQIHFTSLCGSAIVGVKWGEKQTDPCEIDILEISIPAIVQLLFSIWSNEELQKRILKSRGTDLYESDGHYGKQTEQEFVDGLMKIWWIDRKIGRRLCETLQTQYSPNTKHLKASLILRDPKILRKLIPRELTTA